MPTVIKYTVGGMRVQRPRIYKYTECKLVIHTIQFNIRLCAASLHQAQI